MEGSSSSWSLILNEVLGEFGSRNEIRFGTVLTRGAPLPEVNPMAGLGGSVPGVQAGNLDRVPFPPLGEERNPCFVLFLILAYFELFGAWSRWLYGT